MNIDRVATTTGNLTFSTDNKFLFLIGENLECVWNDLEQVDNVRINGTLLKDAIMHLCCSEKHQLVEKCEHKFYSKIFGSNTAANNLNRN